MSPITREVKDALVEQFMKISNGPFGVTNAIHIAESFPVSEPILPQGKNDDGWIPVSDEMNLENHEHVFVYKTGWKKPIPAIFIKMDKREDRFRSADAGGTLLEPTHYMKVTNPPISHK